MYFAGTCTLHNGRLEQVFASLFHMTCAVTLWTCTAAPSLWSVKWYAPVKQDQNTVLLHICTRSTVTVRAIRLVGNSLSVIQPSAQRFISYFCSIGEFLGQLEVSCQCCWLADCCWLFTVGLFPKGQFLNWTSIVTYCNALLCLMTWEAAAVLFHTVYNLMCSLPVLTWY